MTTISRKVKVTPGYRCPFCPNHQDEDFYRSALIDVPICAGCAEELFHFCHNNTRPVDRLIEKVEQITGRNWNECRIILLRDNLEQWIIINRERPEDWLKTTMEHFVFDEDEAWSYVKQRIRWYTDLITQAEATSSHQNIQFME